MENVITINGIKYSFKPGETILDVARRNGIDIPTLCFLEGAPPTGACRMCIVEVKGMPAPAAACSTPATEGMEILTDSHRIITARKMVIELLLISGNHNCAVRGSFPQEWTDFQKEVEDYDMAEDICVAYGRCELQALAYKYQVTKRTLDRIPTSYPLEYDDPLIGRDFSRCILCGRCVQACVEIQVNNALSHGYRGNAAKIVVKGDRTLPDSDCVYCGECVQSCPVGALFEKRNRFNSRIWDVKHVRTTCHYCGIGCQLDLHIKDQKIVKVRGIREAEPNIGRLCFKGRFAFDFIHSESRLTKPLVRKNGKLVESSWDQALDLIATKLGQIKKEKGGDSICCLVSTKYTNEDLFQAKKFFNTVTSSEDVLHFEPPAYIGIPYEELKEASLIVVVGADMTRDNPVAATFIKQAVLNGSRLIVVDARTTELTKFAHKHLKKLTELKKEIDQPAVVIHDPGYDISSLRELDNVAFHSLSRENNTLGAYLIDIHPREDFDLGDKKFIYAMGEYIEKQDESGFLVVQDIFHTKMSKKADVVLPAAVWVEYDGTYVSSDGRINRVRKAINSPGEARPPWWIFRELAKRMGHDWEPRSGKEIWEQEIILNYPHFEAINYGLLDGDGVKIEKIKLEKISIPRAGKLPHGITRPSFQKILCLHSQDLEDVVKKRFKEGG